MRSFFLISSVSYSLLSVSRLIISSFPTHFFEWDTNFAIDLRRLLVPYLFSGSSIMPFCFEMVGFRIVWDVNTLMSLDALREFLVQSIHLCHFSLQIFYLSSKSCDLLFLRCLFFWDRMKSEFMNLSCLSGRRFLTSTIELYYLLPGAPNWWGQKLYRYM